MPSQTVLVKCVPRARVFTAKHPTTNAHLGRARDTRAKPGKPDSGETQQCAIASAATAVGVLLHPCKREAYVSAAWGNDTQTCLALPRLSA